MRRDLVNGERDLLCTAGFGQDKAVSLMKRNPTPQIWKGEGRFPITTIGRTYELEQRLIFRDRQKLPLAKHPSRGCEVSREHTDFTNIGLCHDGSPRWGWGRCPAKQCRSSG